MISESLMVMCRELEQVLQEAYEQGVTLPEAEKLAARFLVAQMNVANELRVTDLDARMKKNGVKAIKAALYLDVCQKSDKKPSDTYIEQVVNSSEITTKQQDLLDTAEVDTDLLTNYLNVFRDAHIYYRSLTKNQG